MSGDIPDISIASDEFDCVSWAALAALSLNASVNQLRPTDRATDDVDDADEPRRMASTYSP
jgi:hypothetical protein